MATVSVFGALLLVWWFTVAPTQIGGPSTYAVTSGVSMEPLLHAGDFALVRQQTSYRVGQVVLYESPVLHRPVLHRIVAIQGGHYFFRGDNNDFVDPGYATRAELVGTLWFAVPALGSVLRWAAKPVCAAILAGTATLAVMAMALGGDPRRRHRRRRHHPRSHSSLGRA